MRSSYSENDVILLLKDVTGLIAPKPAGEREKLIQSGTHYSEMLPLEYAPSEKYMQVYYESLSLFAKPVALAIGQLSDKIIRAKGDNVVLVSLARAGTPIGILVRKFIGKKYGIDIPHYSISIIRERGIDDNAMKFLLNKYKASDLLFLDGWIGKGAILGELKKAVAAYKGLSDEIAVVADPANVTDLCGTHEDILIPSACLNSTVSGLISRTILRNDIIGENDYHGAVYYEKLRSYDLSYDYINTIENSFETVAEYHSDKKIDGYGIDEVYRIAKDFNIENINFIKPGIGETTRVLLRRIPWKILIDPRCRYDAQLKPLISLSEEKDVKIELYNLKHYKCCGIIKNIGDT